MLFPVEEDVTDSDLQLRLCDKPQTPHGSDSDEAKETSPYRPPETLYLSRSQLQKVPENVTKNRALKYLYLEGNELCSIPEFLFTRLPNLLWLDLRHNHVQSVPAGIGRHRCLRTLLLEGNPITELPPELGNVLSLSGLNLRDCPLRYPPLHVLQRGVRSILQYLRAALAQRPVSAPKSPPEAPAEAPAEAPVVERLPLELMESEVDEEEEGVAEEEELRRFGELKLQMSLMEKLELDRAARPSKAHTLPALRKKATRAGVTPLQLDAPVRSRSEEKRQAALRELREKEAVLEQRRKSQEALRKWWTQAKTPQRGGHRQKAGRQRHTGEEKTDTRPRAENSDLDQHQAYATVQCEESRAVQNLQQKIYAIVQRMEERRRNPPELTVDLVWEAELDVKKMRSLQAQLFDIKRGRAFGLYSVNGRQKET